jgi:Family of unknown function (DUF5996)
MRNSKRTWMQIVGKVKLKLHPHINHWWQTALYVTARGMTTGLIPSGRNTFEIAFDFIDHRLLLFTSTGIMRAMPLLPRSYALSPTFRPHLYTVNRTR